MKGTDPSQIQHATMSFADRYMTAMADVYDKALLETKDPSKALQIERFKILAGGGAMTNAVDPNPIVGLMDMAVMVQLTREITDEPWAEEMFGPSHAAAIRAELKEQERDIWELASTYLTSEQITELKDIVTRWRQENPNQIYVAGARLADFPEGKPSSAAAQQLANSVFNLIRLDPFGGLDPAIQEVERSRILAERLFYYLQHTPILLAWEIDAISFQMLDRPQIQQIIDDTTSVAASTTRFSDSTQEFADATKSVAKSVEDFRLQLPKQQATLVDQLNQLLTDQLNSTLKQATTQVSFERDATIKQLDTSVTAQQDAIAKNLQVVVDTTVDRLYGRLRSLILIIVGSILAAFVIYRLIATFVLPKKANR